MISNKQLKFHIKRQKELRAGRSNWDTNWQELSTYLAPGRITVNYKRSPGSKTKTLYDHTGALAAQRLAAGLYSRTVNPASKWFFLGPDEQNQELLYIPRVATWLDNARDTAQATMNKKAAGSFYQIYLDLVTLGSAVLFIDEVPLKGPRYFTYPIDQIDIAENAEGIVDTVYRSYKMALRQIEQEFPDTVGQIKKYAELIDKEPDKQYDIMHAVFPRTDRDPDKYDNVNMPVASVYILTEENLVLQESGYPEMPYIVPRLEVLSGEKYGRGPGNIALPEVKSLNELQKVRLDNAHLKSRPPLDVPLHAYVNPLHMIPGYKNLNQDESGKIAKPLHVAGDLSYQTADIKESRAIIKEMFYNDQLYLREGPQMTATEVRERMDLQMQLMGPWQGRLEPEFFEPVVVRTLGILMRQGIIPPPPEELIEVEYDHMAKAWTPTGETKNIKVIYDSPLARAQRLADVSVIDNTKNSLALISSVNPEEGMRISQHFNLAQMEIDRARALGLPNKYIKQPEQVQAEEGAAAQKQQQAEALTVAKEGSEALKNIKDVPGGGKVTKDILAKLAAMGT